MDSMDQKLFLLQNAFRSVQQSIHYAQWVFRENSGSSSCATSGRLARVLSRAEHDVGRMRNLHERGLLFPCLACGRHEYARGSAAPGPSHFVMEYLEDGFPSLHQMMSERLAQPASYLMQAQHEAKFGQSRPWQPTALLLKLRLRSLSLGLPLEDASVTELEELRPADISHLRQPPRRRRIPRGSRKR